MRVKLKPNSTVYAGKSPGYEVIHQVPAAIHMCSAG